MLVFWIGVCLRSGDTGTRRFQGELIINSTSLHNHRTLCLKVMRKGWEGREGKSNDQTRKNSAQIFVE